MRQKLHFLTMLMCIALIGAVHAQQRVVTGTVTASEDGSAIPGVNVVLKGTAIGTITDIDGKYKINVPQEGGTLAFSFIGMTSQEVAVGNQSVINVSMEAGTKQLTEVIVTAQGIEREKKRPWLFSRKCQRG